MPRKEDLYVNSSSVDLTMKHPPPSFLYYPIPPLQPLEDAAWWKHKQTHKIAMTVKIKWPEQWPNAIVSTIKSYTTGGDNAFPVTHIYGKQKDGHLYLCFASSAPLRRKWQKPTTGGVKLKVWSKELAVEALNTIAYALILDQCPVFPTLVNAWGTHDGKTWTEWLWKSNQQTLQQLLYSLEKEQGFISRPFVWNITIAVLYALFLLHQEKVTHKNLSLSNIHISVENPISILNCKFWNPHPQATYNEDDYYQDVSTFGHICEFLETKVKETPHQASSSMMWLGWTHELKYAWRTKMTAGYALERAINTGQAMEWDKLEFTPTEQSLLKNLANFS